jgi:hypothetical protein
MVKKINNQQPYLLKLNISKNDYLIEQDKSFSKVFSPMSGSELKYEPEKWNIPGIKDTHNCYGYALGKKIKEVKSKQQPGYSSGYKHIPNSEYQCEFFLKRLKKDAPSSYVEKFDKPCLPGFYKIFMALDKENDYHWYAQNTDGYWSHKPGLSEVTNLDASKKRIKNPQLANRDYGYLNYKTGCFFGCINSDLSRSLGDIYNINNN